MPEGACIGESECYFAANQPMRYGMAMQTVYSLEVGHCTTYEQAWEMCKLPVDERAKGEVTVSVAELTFTLVFAWTTIHSTHAHHTQPPLSLTRNTQQQQEPALSGRTGRT